VSNRRWGTSNSRVRLYYCYPDTMARAAPLYVDPASMVATDVSPLAKIGSASRTMPKEATVLLRGAFDLGVRRKPEAFAADAVSLWRLNQSLLINNELALCDAKSI
jgi:hypothetical protein